MDGAACKAGLTTRREFLGLAGQAGFGALAFSAAGDALVRRGPAEAHAAAAGEAVREFWLFARRARWELAPGKVIEAWTYNGQVPGPEIRVREGERVRTILKNELPEPTTIHWHGVDVPNPMDGVPGVTQEPVMPGETFLYEFTARPPGTRWYHSRFQEHKQLDLGLAGPLIIEPARRAGPASDREYTLVLDDWANEMGARYGPSYDTFTINGKAYPATEPLRVRKGERVRLRLINTSSEHTHVIRLAGHRLMVTHTDGNPLVQPVEVDAVPIAPSERYDVQFVADRPGAWFLYCAQPGHPAAGEQVLVMYEGHEGARPEGPVEGVSGLSLWRYGLGRGHGLPHRSSGRERTFALTLDGTMASDVWTINGKRYPRTDPLRVSRGELVRVRIDNVSAEAHPMHLHGQSFRLLAFDGHRLREPIVKDTVDLAPLTGRVDIEFVAHNPGKWLLHCHKPMHMEGGMITLVDVG